MSLLISSSNRRRKLLFAAAAIAAGGYASYRIYNSSAFAYRRKRLLQVLSTLSFCCEALSGSAESISILSSDLKSFLLSDDDSVPQSLKQAFKIGQSEEFQGTVTVLSAALTRGLLRVVNRKPRKEGHSHVGTHGLDQPVKPRLLLGKGADLGGEDVACREIREVCFTAKRQERPRDECDREHTSLPNRPDCQDWEIKSYSSGSDILPWRTRRVGVVLDKLRKGKTSEDMVDKVFSKLFSEPGVGFVSAITGTLARGLVLAFFDAANKQKILSKISSTDGEAKTSETFSEQRHIGYEKVIDVINTAPCRILVAECIQTFISTAITVYIDKTKDVNFYNDVAAGITNPSHRDPMKDVLTSVCNGAVETLVKTSYGVMAGGNEGQRGFTHSSHQCSPSTSRQGQLLGTMGVRIEKACGTSSESLTNVERSNAPAVAKAGPSTGRLAGASTESLEGNNQGGMQSFIDGVSRTLAVPSNRKLVVDVAGTITSEAVRSFVDVVLRTASSTMHESWDRVKSCVFDQQGLQLQERCRDMAVKAFVLASVCLAICLHMLTSFQHL